MLFELSAGEWTEFALELLGECGRDVRTSCSSKTRCEHRSELFARPMQAALERCHTDPQDVRGLLRAETLDVAKDEHFSALVVQALDPSCDAGPGFLVLERRQLVGTLRGRGHSLDWGDVTGRRLPDPTPALLDAKAPRDRIDPGRKLPLAPKVVEIPRHSEHRLLQDVFGILLVPTHAKPKAVDLRLNLAQDGLEGLSPSRPGSLKRRIIHARLIYQSRRSSPRLAVSERTVSQLPTKRAQKAPIGPRS